MDIVLIIIGVGILGAIAYLGTKIKAPANNEDKYKEEIAKLSEQNKQVWAQNTKLEERNKSLQDQNSKLEKSLSRFEEQEERKVKEFEDKITKLDSAKESLEDEKLRIRREDEERQIKEIAERDRMWAEHEITVISSLNDICKLPEYSFTTYDNNNLPDGFDGTLKPDFMIAFLDQYVIFDAKVSRSNNLQDYINTQVKNTVKKIENNSQIYPTIFFVVPTDGIKELKKTYHFEKGYAFFVISPEAIPPIVSSLKKISNYEFAEQMSPQDRDNIVNLIAEFDHHINFRNAYDLVLTQMGVNILNKAEKLTPEMQEEVAIKRNKMRLETPAPTELKQLMQNIENQQSRVHKFVAPKAEVPSEHINQAKEVTGI